MKPALVFTFFITTCLLLISCFAYNSTYLQAHDFPYIEACMDASPKQKIQISIEECNSPFGVSKKLILTDQYTYPIFNITTFLSSIRFVECAEFTEKMKAYGIHRANYTKKSKEQRNCTIIDCLLQIYNTDYFNSDPAIYEIKYRVLAKLADYENIICHSSPRNIPLHYNLVELSSLSVKYFNNYISMANVAQGKTMDLVIMKEMYKNILLLIAKLFTTKMSAFYRLKINLLITTYLIDLYFMYTRPIVGKNEYINNMRRFHDQYCLYKQEFLWALYNALRKNYEVHIGCLSIENTYAYVKFANKFTIAVDVSINQIAKQIYKAKVQMEVNLGVRPNYFINKKRQSMKNYMKLIPTADEIMKKQDEMP